MPRRNLVRTLIPGSYYHIYNRGINKRKIFLEDSDYHKFLSLFDRHLGDEPTADRLGRGYRWLKGDIEVLAYCLMPNHFHLLIYQEKEHALPALMTSIGTEYSMYFNKKYGRSGPLFESTYKASLITSDSYLLHISRYIHLNPPEYKTWKFSSYRDYLSKERKGYGWLRIGRIKSQFSSAKEYEEFVNDYVDMKKSLDLIKTELADR